MDILTKEDTLFGSIAYGNKLISQEELTQCVKVVQNNPGMRLGDVLVQKGYISQDEVRAILDIQRKQLSIIDERTPPTPPTSPPMEPGAAPPPTATVPRNSNTWRTIWPMRARRALRIFISAPK